MEKDVCLFFSCSSSTKHIKTKPVQQTNSSENNEAPRQVWLMLTMQTGELLLAELEEKVEYVITWCWSICAGRKIIHTPYIGGYYNGRVNIADLLQLL